MEPLSLLDSDASEDIHERTSGVNTLVSTGPVNGAGPAENGLFAAGGGRIFFGTSAGLVTGDNDGSSDIYERTAGTTLATPGIQRCFYEQGCERVLSAVSESGDRFIFYTDAFLSESDGDFCGYDDIFREEVIGCYDIYERSGGTYRQVTTGTTTGGDDFDQYLVGVSADANTVLFETYETLMPTDQDNLDLDTYVWRAGTMHPCLHAARGSSGGNSVEGSLAVVQGRATGPSSRPMSASLRTTRTASPTSTSIRTGR